MLTLHYFPNSCAFVPQVALQWSGLPHENKEETRESIKTPEYLALNPAGQVPLLEDGDFALTQNIAIVNYIHDLAPDAGIFGHGDIKAQAKARQWLSFANADLHSRSFSLIFGAPRLFDDPDRQQAIADKGRANVLRLFAIADNALKDKDYLSGEKTIADVYLYITTRWAAGVGIDISHLPHLNAWQKRIEADAGVQAVLKIHRLT